MSTQRSAADAAIVDLFERWGEGDDIEEHDVDLVVDLLGLTGSAPRRRP